MIWCLLFMVSVLSAIHFSDGQAADDALEAIEVVVDGVPDKVLLTAKPNKGSERAIKVVSGETVKQPGQCLNVKHWVAYASDAPDTLSTSVAAPDHPNSASELWLPPPPMVLAPGLRVARVHVALPPFQADPIPAPMLCPPARA